MHKNPSLIKVWAARHESPEALKEVKQKFQITELLRTFKAVHADWGKRIDLLYNASIDWGAHPNERSVHGSLKIHEQDDAVNFDITYLSNNAELIETCTLHTLRTGAALLQILKAVFSDRFTPELSVKLEALNLADITP